MLIFLHTLVYIIVFAMGAVVGSFLNVLIYRLPRRVFIFGRTSRCPFCMQKLRRRDRTPILSYLVLRGKRRCCCEPLSPRYMITEFLAGSMAALSWHVFFPDIKIIVLNFVVIACLIAVTWIDNDTMEIPDSLNIAIAVCGVFAIFIVPDIGLRSQLAGIAVAAVPLFVVAIFIEGAFGFGDVKLMASAGLFLGWQNCLLALFIGIIIGGVYGAILLAARKKRGNEHFAFGPALCVGIGLSIFAGDELISLYLGA